MLSQSYQSIKRWGLGTDARLMADLARRRGQIHILRSTVEDWQSYLGALESARMEISQKMRSPSASLLQINAHRLALVAIDNEISRTVELIKLVALVSKYTQGRTTKIPTQTVNMKGE